MPAAPIFPASLQFASNDDVVYVELPTGITKGYVSSSYSDVTATMALQLVTLSGTAVNISTSSSSQTNLSAYAGTLVTFKVSGMDASAKVGAFGMRLSA
jgi:hypothetical protein